MGVQLNFVNQSNDANNSQIVIFQKNVASDFEELAVAWRVIKYCGQGDNHPFTFPLGLQVGASDSYGNHTPQLEAQFGQQFQLSLSSSGDRLAPAGYGASSNEVQVLNSLPRGAINASCYKDGRLLAVKTAIAPQQKAVFEFKPSIWIGVVSQIEQGQVMNSAILSDINTEISLLGISRADIVMRGGGAGPGSTPLSFALENVVMC
ncbi:hypothetical protein JC796_07315 [Delftia acidovorans]|uniref:hypothetical protein n=1 Tax=Delftia acidovorans TaxID=80866 RepID=UPI0018E80C52|nr:hypothetical protein [Delftia acidovorans]MBJ2140531.1 hypothetical protein [Delftia acidovorans]